MEEYESRNGFRTMDRLCADEWWIVVDCRVNERYDEWMRKRTLVVQLTKRVNVGRSKRRIRVSDQEINEGCDVCRCLDCVSVKKIGVCLREEEE